MYATALRREHVRIQATPASTENTLAMCALAELEKPKRAAHDVAILLISLTGGFRPSETAALRLEDFYTRPRGMRVIVRSSKNHYKKPSEVTITQGRIYSPIAALQRWRIEGGITEGYVFRHIDRHDNVGNGEKALLPEAISNLIKRYGTAIGMRGRISGYSMRRGCATTAAENGASLDRLRDHLRHEDAATTMEYIERRPVPFDQSLTPLVLP